MSTRLRLGTTAHGCLDPSCLATIIYETNHNLQIRNPPHARVPAIADLCKIVRPRNRGASKRQRLRPLSRRNLLRVFRPRLCAHNLPSFSPGNHPPARRSAGDERLACSLPALWKTRVYWRTSRVKPAPTKFSRKNYAKTRSCQTLQRAVYVGLILWADQHHKFKHLTRCH